MTLHPPDCIDIVRRALAEDIGTGDVTTQLTVDLNLQADADFVAKQPGIVAGTEVVRQTFLQLDPGAEFVFGVEDGEGVEAGAKIMTVTGNAGAILTGERVALNFLLRLSGIATMTSRFVALTVGTKARIVDTRKTTPGLRVLEKYAVRVGGGRNHRFGLYDAIVIKDNHIQAAGGIAAAVERALAQASHTLSITVECDSLEQVREALDAAADILLLDNMSVEDLAEAVEMVDGQAMTEASGGVNEQTVAAIAQTGVDIISVGALTHSAPALDISLDLRPIPG
jgi:nicotinate-nucleotide pyrophosphorylase (carboxylating)